MNITTLLSLLPLLAASVQASYFTWKGIENVTMIKIHTVGGDIVSEPIEEGVYMQSTLIEPENVKTIELVIGAYEEIQEYDYDEETMLKKPPCGTKVIALAPGRYHTGNLPQLRARLARTRPYGSGSTNRQGGKCPYQGHAGASSGGSKSLPQ